MITDIEKVCAYDQGAVRRHDGVGNLHLVTTGSCLRRSFVMLHHLTAVYADRLALMNDLYNSFIVFCAARYELEAYRPILNIYFEKCSL